jgi:fatty-acid peroxygenase
LALNGYAWLPALWRRGNGVAARTRVMGRHAVALRGPEAVRFFYDERHVRRHAAVPEPVQGTLFGHGAIHTLDGARHRLRKAMFLSLLTDPDNVADLVDRVADAWNETVATWRPRRSVVLFDEASRAVTRGVCGWAGVPLDEDDVAPLARDLTAMVDGFATLGPRHWRARRARGRRERWLAALVNDVREGAVKAPVGSAVEAVSRQSDLDGELLDPRRAAVELLNIIRPTVAMAWFVAFAGHAIHRWPEHRDRLRDEDRAYATAFAHEVRRFYPFAPFVGGRAVEDLTWRGESIPAHALVLLDLFGQNHDAALWPEPYRFDPGRFLGRVPDRDLLIPQGGGDRAAGHRCPGEDVTVALLAAFASWLARLSYEVPPQDLTISLRRIPALPRSRFVINFNAG